MAISRREIIGGFGAVAALGSIPFFLKPKKGNQKIKVVFNFSKHGTQEHLAKLDEVLARFKPHAVCQESYFETKEGAERNERMFTSDATPNITPNHPSREFILGLHKTLRKHKIGAICTPEIFPPDEAEQYKTELHRNDTTSQHAMLQFYMGNPTEAIAKYREYLTTLARLTKIREERVGKAMETLHDDLVKQHPQLKDEDEIRVVFNYGPMHLPLADRARKIGFQQVEATDASEIHLWPAHKYVINANQGKQSNSDEEVARTLIGDSLGDYASRLSGMDNANSGLFGEHFAKQITLNQFKRLSRAIATKTATSRPNSIEESNQIIQDCFHQEGLELPKNKKEVDRFLRSKQVEPVHD